MRTIEVSTNVFSRIWALRKEGEESEDAILARVLSQSSTSLRKETAPEDEDERLPQYRDRGPRTWSQPTWATDIADVLSAHKRPMRLQEIYDLVEKRRQKFGRSVPPSLEATVRRTLENHSSDSHNYTGGADLFHMPEGKGAGIWALR